MMVGRAVSMSVDKGKSKPGDVVLDVQDLTVLDDAGVTQVRGVTFDVKAGEIRLNLQRYSVQRRS
jgi:simple sugar transport system ATP-binding protein